MNKYQFVEYSSTLYNEDPVFKSKDFSLFGDPRSIGDSPDLFYVNYSGKTFRYCLTSPKGLRNNELLLLKIKRYLMVQDSGYAFEDEPQTFFIGDVDVGAEASSDFINQRIVLVDYKTIEKWYPKRLEDIYIIIIRKVLKEQKHLGQIIRFGSIGDDYIFLDPHLNDNEKRQYKRYLFESMEKDGYISIIKDSLVRDMFVVTSKGISFAEDSEKNCSNKAFIAIRFSNNSDRINAIYEAISESGFEPLIMNRMETNNWIMPEIFHQIETCRFVVADFSIRCDGAYYEAGYAAALKKPVIHLFDKREEKEDNKLHFDIAQKSTIFYESYDELKRRLKERIDATIKKT